MERTELTRQEAAAAYVIIPAHDEATVIRATVSGVLALGVHVVVVDDCSGDDTVAQLAGQPVTVLRHAINLGQGAALQTGIDFALARGARFLVTFDADGQHDPAAVARMLIALVDGGHDVVLGSRHLGSTVGMGRVRRCVLWAAVRFTRLTTGMAVTDVHNGLRAFSADAAKRLQLSQNRMAHASEILERISRARLSWAEVPVSVTYTEYSKAKGQTNLGAIDILYELTIGRFLG